MVIEITDCASRGKVYHNVKLLDGRRADVAVGPAIDGLAASGVPMLVEIDRG